MTSSAACAVGDGAVRAPAHRTIHVVSVSTGKDSGATALMALEQHPLESLRFAACDTGNEHESFHTYLDYMQRQLGIRIDVLRADLSGEVLRRRDYIREHWPQEGLSQTDVDRAVAALVPTGNPFLDLCLWKGRFPSRRAQFCTDFLKTRPLVEYQMGLIERGECDSVWSWQGVRLEESEARRTRLQGTGACVIAFDERGGGLFNYRPILRWKWADVFGQVRALLSECAIMAAARERQRMACDVAGLHMAQSVNNQNHPNAWHDGVDAALAVIREA